MFFRLGDGMSSPSDNGVRSVHPKHGAEEAKLAPATGAGSMTGGNSTALRGPGGLGRLGAANLGQKPALFVGRGLGMARPWRMRVEPELVGKTYDDFLVRPQRAVVATRRDVSLEARLSRRIVLQLPIVSANMDSVTEAKMARALALEGGIG